MRGKTTSRASTWTCRSGSSTSSPAPAAAAKVRSPSTRFTPKGQRRYVETFSPYTRQFLDRMDKPKVDRITGIPPAIAIEQSNQVKSTRSTVGTITEINDYLKLLMPRVAHAFCPSCHGPIKPDSSRGIAEQILDRRAGATMLLTFAVSAPVGAVPAEFFAFLQAQGYLRVFIDGNHPPHRRAARRDLKRLPLRVNVIQDRSVIDAGARSRLTESIETALAFRQGAHPVHRPGERRRGVFFHRLALPEMTTSISNRPRRACSRSTIRLAHARNAVASGAPSASISTARCPTSGCPSRGAWSSRSRAGNPLTASATCSARRPGRRSTFTNRSRICPRPTRNSSSRARAAASRTMSCGKTAAGTA